MCCTVSTRQSVPRSRFPLAPPAGGPSRASPAIPDRSLRRGRKAERADSADSSGSDHRRAASKRAGSIPALEAPRTLLRPGFIARPQPAVIEERWSRRPPRRRDGPDCKGSAFSGGQIAARNCDVSEVAGEFCDYRTMDSGIASKRRSLFQRSEGSSQRARKGALPSCPGGEGGRRSRSDEGKVYASRLAGRVNEPSPSTVSLREPPSPPRGEGSRGGRTAFVTAVMNPRCRPRLSSAGRWG